MAVLASPPLILGERPDTNWYPPATPSYEDAPWPVPHELTLMALVREVEQAPETTVAISATRLPDTLRRRTALALVARRSQSRGKAVVMSGADPALASLARSCGWGIAGFAAPQALRYTAVSLPVEAAPAAVHSSKVPAVDLSAVASAPPAQTADVPAARPAQPVELSAARPTGSVRSLALPRVHVPQLRLPDPRAVRLRLPRLRSLPGVRVPPWSGLAGAAALVGSIVLMPGATVTLTTASEQSTLDVPVIVDPSIKKADPSTGRLPGRAISKEVSETAQAPATGKRPAPDARASGEVVLINKTEKPLGVPKGTIVSAGAIKFTTQADLSIPGTVFSGPQQRISMQRVAVLAVNGGLDGNVARFAISKVEGPLSAQLDVQNDAPLKGGSERTVPVVTADDRRKLQESLYTTLSGRLAQQLKGQLPAAGKETLIPWSAQPATVVEATFNKNEGDEAQTVTLTMKVRYGATAFSNDGYNTLIKQSAGARATSARPGYEVAGGVEALPPEIQGIDGGAGTVRLLGHSHVTLRQHVDTGQVRRTVANRSLAAARASLSNLPGVTAAEVQAWPGWLGRTPLLSARVGVRLR